MKRTLEITTKIGCENLCDYCPQDKLLRSYVGNIFMTLEQFKLILSHTPKDIQIDFTGFCEPFLNPQASLMMRHSITEGYKTVLLTTLTGFNSDDAIILKGLEFENFQIHCFQGYDEIKVNATMELLKAVGHEPVMFELPGKFRWSRAGNLWDMPDKKGRFECGWTGQEFYRNVVLPNGDVYLCCMDYSLKHKLGNIYQTHYNDLNRKQIIDLCGQHNSECICRKCEMVKIL